MSETYTFEEKYIAMVRKDPLFEGIFITAVKTTGIFCRPICNARKPKRENVVFYTTVNEAIMNGYRPCRVCKPLEKMNETPAYIQPLLDALASDPFLRLKDNDLRQRGAEPAAVRRWFKKNHNMSFQAYQRMLRLNSAFRKLTSGEKVTTTAFDSGYDSLSGFNHGFRTVFGKVPSQSKRKNVITITRFVTPLGPMFACASDQGICLLEFTNRRMLETEFKDLSNRLNAVILPGDNEHLQSVRKEIQEYFEGVRTSFSVPLHTPGSPFQQKVWSSLQSIPFGETISYKDLAQHMGLPKAVRPIASANACNRISIIIPCHRVLRTSGDLGGYGGGLPRKKWLIEFEKQQASQIDHS